MSISNAIRTIVQNKRCICFVFYFLKNNYVGVGMSKSPPIAVTIHWQSVNDKSSSDAVQITGNPLSVTAAGISNTDGLVVKSPASIQPVTLAGFAPVYVQSRKALITDQGMNKDSEGQFYVASKVVGVNTFWLFIGLQSMAVDANSFQFFVFFLKNFHNFGQVQLTSLDPTDNSGWAYDFGKTQARTLTFTYTGTDAPTYLPWIEMTTTSNPVHSGIALTSLNNVVYPQAIFAWTGPSPRSPRPLRPLPKTSPASKPILPNKLRPVPASNRISPSTLRPVPALNPISPSTSPSSLAVLGLPTWAIIVLVVGSVALILGFGLGFGLRKKDERIVSTIQTK